MILIETCRLCISHTAETAEESNLIYRRINNVCKKIHEKNNKLDIILHSEENVAVVKALKTAKVGEKVSYKLLSINRY